MKRRRFSFLALLMLAVILLMPASTQAAAKLGTVKLTGIKAMDYNKINIKWRKTSGATNYIVYYKKAGASKWTKIKTLDNTKSSYVHTSSKKYPIITGQKYQYTVKAYNSQTKKSGNYNKTGLTARTIPQTAKLVSAKVKNGTVDITWKKAGGADKYFLLYKVQTDEFTTNWTKLATLNADTTSYTVKYPFKNATNIYTVRSYNSASKVYGKYDDKGISVFVTAGNNEGNNNDKDDVGDDITPTPAPVSAEAMASEVIRLTNIERAKAGRSALIYNASLQRGAMMRAKEISIKFSHERPNGESFTTILNECGAGHISGENIAAGQKSPELAVKAWMNSQGHKLTMLNKENLYIGVGFYQDNDGRYYWVQNFADGNPDEKGTVIFDANGGSGGYTYVIPCGQRIYFKNVPIPQKSGYTFVCWVSEYNETNLASTCAGRVTQTFYAKWAPNN
ncbi:MAG: CAP domain-containing protein [Anaerobutyricum hallii]|uniref:CAP domain-containing protein n=1 Tax=Anaerobutyricum hallii TaxID=39488 RepID=UPI00242B0CC6|nr:CAP domain-containing protein [Anaerobutyricum hallii]MDD6589861.1 CAP domain-containing protein [Anaerobutyricum hallii]